MEQRIKFVLKLLIFVPLGLYILSCTYHIIMMWFFNGPRLTALQSEITGFVGTIALGFLLFILVILFFRWLFDIED